MEVDVNCGLKRGPKKEILCMNIYEVIYIYIYIYIYELYIDVYNRY